MVNKFGNSLADAASGWKGVVNLGRSHMLSREPIDAQLQHAPACRCISATQSLPLTAGLNCLATRNQVAAETGLLHIVVLCAKT
jgi:hypothetical protein